MAIIRLRMEKNATLSYDDDKKLGKGGEGVVYEIVSPQKYKDFCVKIYSEKILSDPVDLKEREEKIKFLTEQPVTSNNSSVIICWPTCRVYLGDKLVGFIMRKAFPTSINLEWLNTYRIKPQFQRESKAFDGAEGMKAVYNRLVLANNVAYAIHLIHAIGRYVLVDAKPRNILITAAGNVSIVDLDSVQVVDGNDLKFKATVWSEHFKPPEGYDGRIRQGGDDIIHASWDCFSYAVIAYQLIIGSHPYTGSYNSPFDGGSDFAYKIKNGLFLHGSKSVYLVDPNSPALFGTMARWNSLPSSLRGLFIRAFEHGQLNPQKRPTMAMWGAVLTESLEALQPHIGAGTPPPPQPQPPPPPPPPDGNISAMVYWIAVLVLVAIVLYFLRRGHKEETSTPVASVSAYQVAATAPAKEACAARFDTQLHAIVLSIS